MFRRVGAVLIVVLVLFGADSRAAADHAPSTEPIRFGLTAVVVRDNLRFLDRWADYLGEKMGQPVVFVRRRSYREIMDMLEAGELDFAWICGYPFVQPRTPEFLDIMAVPVYRGAPLYHSYIIVNKEGPIRGIEDLRGKVFAYSDPDSNSGFLYPQSILAQRKLRAGDFFRQTFFTYSHAATIQAVAEHVADGGAVDSYIWDFLSLVEPELTARTRIVDTSPAFGFPPLVARRTVDQRIIDHMAQSLLDMQDDPTGREFLTGLKLDGFGKFEPSLFDSIRKMADDTHKAILWIESAAAKPKAQP